MNYSFKYQNKALDLWQLTMYGIYTSMMGTINIIFTVSMLLLAFKFWAEMGLVFRILCGAGVLLFLVIQPLVIYQKSKKQMYQLPQSIELDMDDDGLHVYAGLEKTLIPWDAVKGIMKKPTLLVLFASNQHGYILSNDVLKSEKDSVYQYVIEKLTPKNI